MNAAVTDAPMPTAFRPRTMDPIMRDTTLAPRRKPPGVDQARDSSQKSSVFTGAGTQSWPRELSHQPLIFFTSKGSTSTARPMRPPGSSG